MIKVLNLSMVLCLAVFLLSCGAKHEAGSSLNTEAKATGPFFAGPNSLIIEVTVDYSAMNGLDNVAANDVAEVILKGAKVNMPSGSELDFSAFGSASLQIVSGNTEMKTLAILNPITTSKNSITLETGEDTDLTEYFKAGKFSLVLDLDFNEDYYEDEIGAVLDLELSVKHN